MDEKKEFTFIKLNIVDLSIIYAMFLIIWGMSISIISESNSITSLIPSILGLPILVFSYLSKVFPSKQKLFMHLVVIIGALIFFIMTNFGVWSMGSYGYTFDGLIMCYTLAIPFFTYSLISTFLFSGIIEGVIKLNLIKLRT